MLPFQGVSLDEVRQFLGGGPSGVPSTMGFQIDELLRIQAPPAPKEERRRAGHPTQAEVEAKRRREEIGFWYTVQVSDDRKGRRRDEEARTERQIFSNARIMNCLAELAAFDWVPFGRYDFVREFAAQTRTRQGVVTISVLRAFETWRSQSEARGLAAVYEWMRSHNPRHVKPVEHREVDVAQAFRLGSDSKQTEASTARIAASNLLADAEIILGDWVDVWNRRAETKARASAARDGSALAAVVIDQWAKPSAIANLCALSTRKIQEYCEDGTLPAFRRPDREWAIDLWRMRESDNPFWRHIYFEFASAKLRENPAEED